MNKSESSALATHDGSQDDELSLSDLILFIRRNNRTLLGGAVGGVVLGLAIAFIVPAQWEASALVRIGQLGNAGNAGNVIEPPLQVVDRVKNRSFQNSALTSLKLPISDSDIKAKSFRNSLKVKLEKSELITLTLRATSPSEAEQNMNAVVNELKRVHNNMATSTVNRWHQELAATEQELQRANTESERLTKALDGYAVSINEKIFSQATLLSNILLTREQEIKNIQDRKRILEERLSPERTFQTDVLGRVEISEQPVFPKKTLLAVAGLVIGLLISVLIVVIGASGSRKNIN